MPVDTTYIPFGTRCTTASLLKDDMQKRVMSLPFDWIDIPVRSMAEFIPDSRQSIEKHVLDYLMCVGYITSKGGSDYQRHAFNETWFPHDFPKDRRATNEEFEEIRAKYVRRFNRLFDVLESKNRIVLLTVIAHIKPENIPPYKEALKKISALTQQEIIPITVNLYDFYSHSASQIKNIPIPLGQDWNLFQAKVCHSLKTHLLTREYFD